MKSHDRCYRNWLNVCVKNMLTCVLTQKLKTRLAASIILALILANHTRRWRRLACFCIRVSLIRVYERTLKNIRDSRLNDTAPLTFLLARIAILY